MKTNQKLFKVRLAVKVLLIGLLSFTVLNAQAQRRHHRKHKHVAHYKYSKLPKWGKAFVSVNKKAYRIAHKGKNYHYYSGIYYKRVGANYVVTKAPIGVRVKVLPKAKYAFRYKGKRYYYYYGTFYFKPSGAKEYLTVVPPMGAQIDALPEGYNEVVINGEQLYEFEGIYYKPIVNDKNEELFEVVGSK